MQGVGISPVEGGTVDYLPLEERNRAQLLLDEESAQREEDEALRGAEEDEFSQGQDGVSQPFLFRLFVGWVPKHYDEKDLTPLFNRFGVVKDIIILREKLSGQKRGCAFVSYATKEEAELAIQNLDRQLQLPGALSLLEVRFAKSHQYVQAGAGPQDNRQLFFTSAPIQLNEPEISTFFSQFGVVEEVNLFRERKTGNSKGCGFITFQAREQAVRAMEALENKSAEPSKEMSVQWADPELQFKKKKALEESNADNRMLFFAKVLRSATEEDVKRLFSQYGKVYDVNLFRAFQGAPTTKGCGLVTMGTHEEARAAIEGLDGKYCCDGLDSPMVVKWMDAALQRRRREQHLAAMLQGLVPSMGAGPSDAWMPQSMALGGGVPGLARGSMPQALLLHEPEVGEAPPAGCAPDAIKLFVGNIPKVCTEEQLLPFFETLGKVAELVIVRDKATHQSKGSAFVWYASRAHAERAILQFNLRHVLPDPTGEQDRPLVVRKARVRAAKPGLPHQGLGAVQGMPKLYAAGSQGQHPSVTMLTGTGGSSSGTPHVLGYAGGSNTGVAGGSTFYAMSPSHVQGSSKVMGGGSQHLQQLDSISMQQSMQHGGGASYLPIATAGGGGYRTVQQLQGGAQLVSIQAAPAVSESGLYEAYGTGANGDHMERYMITTTQSAMHPQQSSIDNMAPLALSVPLTLHQLGLVNNHLFSIQSMSGAQLNISPGAPGLFHLLISGAKGQVESARTLVSQVLGQVIMP